MHGTTLTVLAMRGVRGTDGRIGWRGMGADVGAKRRPRRGPQPLIALWSRPDLPLFGVGGVSTQKNEAKLDYIILYHIILCYILLYYIIL